MSVLGVGLQETWPLKVNVVPNPFSNYINLQIDEVNAVYTVELLSLDGRVLKRTYIENGNGEIITDNLPAAIYTLRITGNGQANALRLVKLLQP